MPIARLLAALLLCASLTQAQAEASQPLPSVAVPAEVDALLRSYERAWAAKDVAALAALFAPNGMALANGSPPAQGAAAIAAEYAKNAGGPLALRALAFAQSQDLAYVIGGFSQRPGDADAGKFVLVLQRVAGGSWRIVADMDNLNALPRRPAPPAPPAQPASRP